MADGNSENILQESTPVDFSSANLDKSDAIDTASSSNSSMMAEGLYSLISSVMKDSDSTAEETNRSQDQLAFALDRLTRELDKLLDDAPSPFIMQHAARISGVRKRVKALNTLLNSIQHRVDNMDRMMSAGLVRETSVGESTGQPHVS